MIHKTLLVGWDSVSWTFLMPLLAKNELPNLQQLIDTGYHGILRSTVPPVTPVAWGSINTGKLPQKHGIYDWAWDPLNNRKIEVSNSSDLIGSRFWEKLNAQGIRVGLVNIPMTYPIKPIDGFIICGFGAPRPPANITYPQSLLSDIETEYGAYEPMLTQDVIDDLGISASEKAVFETEALIQARQVQAALLAEKRYEVDLLAINLMLFDHTNHSAEDYALIEGSLRETDRQLGLLIEGFKPDDILLISDHGAKRYRGVFLIGDWLRDRGYLIPQRRDSQDKNTLNWLLFKYLRDGHGMRGVSEKVLRRLLRNLIPHLNGKVAGRFWQSVQALTPRGFESYWFEPIATETDSSPISRVLNIGMLYLNKTKVSLENDAALHQFSSELIMELSKVQHPEKDLPLFQGILSKDDLYGKGPLGNPPDLFVDFQDSEYDLFIKRGADLNLRYPYFAYIRDNPNYRHPWYGGHHPDGIYLFNGASFNNGSSIDPGHVVDIPASLLYLYHVPIPEDYDGKVQKEAMVLDYPILCQPGDAPMEGQIRPNESEDELETKEILSRLRDLGYIE